MNIQKIVSRVLIWSIGLLTLVSILSIWKVFDQQVLWKAMSTIVMLTFGSAIIIIVSRLVEDKKTNKENE